MSSTLGYADSIILGVVEGLTEFLPVSSTGHLTIAEKVLGLKVDDPAITSFTAIVQFGAIVATFLYFRADIVRLAVAWVRGLLAMRNGKRQAPATRALAQAAQRTGPLPGTPVTSEPGQTFGSQTGHPFTGHSGHGGETSDGGAPDTVPRGLPLRRDSRQEPADPRDDPDYRFAWFVIAGSLPIVVIAVAAKPLITGPLRSLWVVAGALILWSAVMWWAERNPRQELGEEDLSLRQVVSIGLMQCVALVPGVSRSGATISGGLLLGATRLAATRLSFFLAIPALTGAGLYSLKDVDTSVVGWGELAVGTLVAFVVAYASIAWLLKLVAGHAITVFNPYRVVVGIALIALLASGVMSAT